MPEEFILSEVYSGLTLDRPKLPQLRQWVRDREIDVLIAYNLVRLSREPVNLIILQEEIEKSGVELVLVTETVDSSDLGKFILHAKGLFAKWEAEKIKERTMRGMLQRIQNGKLPGGRRAKLYGYNYMSGKGLGEGICHINETEAHWVREIYRWFVEEGLTLNGIVYRLRSLGVPSPSGSASWCRATVYNILRNMKYTGKTYVFIQRIVNGKVVPRPREEWLEIPNVIPLIVGEELFAQAQAKFQRNKELAPRNSKRRYLLSGYLFCRYCGMRYLGRSATVTAKGIKQYHRYYYCPNRFRIKSPETCKNCGWKGDHLETMVWAEIEHLLTKPEVIYEGVRERQKEAGNRDSYLKELETIELRFRHAEKEKTRIWKAFELTGDEGRFTMEIKDLDTKVDELEKRKSELERRIKAIQQGEVDIQGIQRFCELARSNLANFSFEDKRLALEALQIKVWLDGERITIEGAVPVTKDIIASTMVKCNCSKITIT